MTVLDSRDVSLLSADYTQALLCPREQHSRQWFSAAGDSLALYFPSFLCLRRNLGRTCWKNTEDIVILGLMATLLKTLQSL